MSRPLPRATAETAPFWESCAEEKLRYQRCARCGAVQLIPRALCSECQSLDLNWLDSDRRGSVLTFTIVYRAPSESFRSELPYAIALVDMDEGFRLMVNVSGGASAALQIGSRVSIGFRQLDGIAVPHAEVVE
ncbi:hypothetical protein DR64_7587 [Paraburkholderia xenovorans LB400]|uniref:DUF35 domain-containing protein n=1 Tax=Paraburkholderia xenovorans (strain LB400) TaxID=266265 RepID=Q13GQ1_PARXL|nr:Zn-ribbon domain-containing OB-fold protein [Paraburkholderia xenovorans]ABE36738.1 Conserved hypothetical protein [Paraburkholderia xenovorans LB400]AIP34446.1 hypothetical protein DR64_7587 [Paraburkholderia xenovorans LB400]